MTRITYFHEDKCFFGVLPLNVWTLFVLL